MIIIMMMMIIIIITHTYVQKYKEKSEGNRQE